MNMNAQREGYLRPKLSMMDHRDCLQIHMSACEILHKTGVQVFSEAGLNLLQEAGSRIEGNLVKIPPSLVEWALASVPDSFELYKRGTDEIALKLDGSEVAFGPGSDTLRYLDPLTGKHRAYQLSDVADCVRLCDALSEIDFVMSVGIPQDVPEEQHYRYQFSTMVRNTSKPIVFVCNTREDIEAIAAMAAEVAGGMEKLKKFPSILLYSEPTTPLQHSLEATEKLLFCAEYSIPVTHSPAPMMGGTAPVTLAGAVALANAEILSSLVMHQLQNEGAPFLYGHGVHHLDMRTMVSVYGAPEYQLARIMAAEMGRFYHLPVWGYGGHTDSKVVDAQAAVDAQFSVQIALMAQTNLNHDVGYIDSGLASSPELMVLTNEIISMNRHFERGFRFDKEAFALDVIHEIGPGGDFLSHDHTLDHWRWQWLPKLFNRQRFEEWESQGKLDINDLLREKTVSLMRDHIVEPPPDPVIAELDRMLA